jgi:dUTP pyrophosphatase
MTATPTLEIQLLRDDAILPTYATAGAAGMDLHASLQAPRTLQPGERAAIPTGIALALPAGYEGQVRPRSGLSSKHGVTVVNAPGTVDEDYRGEVHVLLVNLGQEPYTVQPKDRIAQLVVAPVTRVRVLQVSELGATARGGGGFGSTGR